jgi:uncharacterized protein YjiS (DUF1127 family)
MMSSFPRVPSIPASPLPGRSGAWLWPAGGAVLTRIVLWPVRLLRARREFERLAVLSDYELRDIGLTRQDLRDASALRLDEDPTLHLARLSERRRRGRRPGPA